MQQSDASLYIYIDKADSDLDPDSPDERHRVEMLFSKSAFSCQGQEGAKTSVFNE
jgi:hypothetical protein